MRVSAALLATFLLSPAPAAAGDRDPEPLLAAAAAAVAGIYVLRTAEHLGGCFPPPAGAVLTLDRWCVSHDPSFQLTVNGSPVIHGDPVAPRADHRGLQVVGAGLLVTSIALTAHWFNSVRVAVEPDRVTVSRAVAW